MLNHALANVPVGIFVCVIRTLEVFTESRWLLNQTPGSQLEEIFLAGLNGPQREVVRSQAKFPVHVEEKI